MATSQQPAPQATPAQPATAVGPVGDPGSIFDHIFRLADAIQARNWQEAFRLTMDIFGHLQQPMQVGGMAAAAPGAADPAAIANQLRSLAGQHGGQPGTPKGQAAVQAVDWGN